MFASHGGSFIRLIFSLLGHQEKRVPHFQEAHKAALSKKRQNIHLLIEIRSFCAIFMS